MRLFNIPPITICAEKEKLHDAGEDSFAYAFENQKNGYIAAFDGCGGMGARKYSTVGNRTGAYIASKLAACITDDFYNNQQFRFNGNDALRLCNRFKECFQQVKKTVDGSEKIMIGGDLFKSLPTTVSIAAININENICTCEYIWAGDSRGYFLDSHGLCQITKDDIQTEEDAFSNLRSDGKMSNVVHADGEFVLHERSIEFNSPVMIITSTDGAFGYYSTPMEFEYLILNSLCESDSAEEWEQAISDAIVPITGDDFTLCIAAFGFKNFKECRKYFSERSEYIKSEFIDNIHGEETAYDELELLWNKYKANYYRW